MIRHKLQRWGLGLLIALALACFWILLSARPALAIATLSPR